MDIEQNQTPGQVPGPLPEPGYPARRKWLMGLAAVGLVAGGVVIGATQSPQIMGLVSPPRPPIEEPRLGGVPLPASEETSTTPTDDVRTSGVVAPDFVPSPDISK